MSKGICVPLLVFLLLPCLLAGGNPVLGTVDFPTSGSPQAQTAFLQGVLWLHSFEYENAKQAFQESEKLDPGFAMAYWGEAMTYNHPIWMQRDRDAAIAALNKLAPTPEGRLAKARTQREKDYVAAVDILYGEGEKKDRDAAYCLAMQKLHEKYPDDLEAASFYALSILGMCEGKRDHVLYMKAAAVAEEVFAKNPNHPGAAHYLIHSYDDPVHAALGLRAARVYARIAPSATHALHMPSHIFLALGMWDDVISSNIASWEASKHSSYHAMHWLEYGYLQKGRFEEARKLLEQIEENVKKDGAMPARHALAMMRAGYIVESQKWKDDAVAIRVDTADFSDAMSNVGADLFATGYARLKSGDVDGAEKTLAELDHRLTASKGAQQTQTARTYFSDLESEWTFAEISRMELESAVLLARGKKDEALKRIAEAAAREDATPYDFGPPVPVKPTHELWGEMLLELGHGADARAQFQLALDRAPGRRLSLQGLNASQ